MTMLRSAPLMGFRKTVRDLGGDPDEILKELKLSPLILEDPELVITHESLLRLLNHAAKETRCKHFGFLLAKQVDLSVFGTIGLLLQNADTVGDALDSFTRYYPTRYQGALPSLTVEGDLAFLHFHLIQARENTRQQMYLATGIGIMLMKSLCGETWRPIEFHSIDKMPENANALTRYFGAPLRFGQEFNRMVFKSSDLKQKISGKTGRLKRYIQPHIEMLENQLPKDIVSTTEYLIRVLLRDRKCNIENVTSILSIGERSLQRKLKTSGTSYRELLEKIRKSIAQQHLLHSDLSQTQLADLLGFSELSAFTLAFKRWFGMPPSKWKNKEKST